MTNDRSTLARFRILGVFASAALIAVLLALAPFAAALEVHHALAEADQDGHQHSEFDLCQWVQLHSASSFDLGVPDIEVFAQPQDHDPPVTQIVLSVAVLATGPSRAPPLS